MDQSERVTFYRVGTQLQAAEYVPRPPDWSYPNRHDPQISGQFLEVGSEMTQALRQVTVFSG
jgi:hypothetical protein